MTMDAQITNINARSFMDVIDGVYYGPNTHNTFLIDNKETLNATIYFPQDTNLNIMHCQDFENDKGI